MGEIPLTATAVKAARPQKPYTLTDEKGLLLIVQPSGARWWRKDGFYYDSARACLGGRSDRARAVLPRFARCIAEWSALSTTEADKLISLLQQAKS
jgi:hypothetical protein